MRSTTIAAGLAALLALGLAGCGDDSENGTEDAGSASDPTQAAGLAPELCESYLAIGRAVEGLPDDESAMGDHIEQQLVPAVDDLVAAAPEDLADEASILQASAQAGVDDPSQIQTEEALAAYGAVGAATHEDCGWAPVDVSAVDYGYEGVPDTVPAGQVSIAMANEGSEEHEMIVFRRDDGETRPVEELLALPEAEADEVVTFTTATFAPPGETGYTTAELEAGSYFGVCFIPVGGAEDGPPHFTEGMITEFEVG